MKLSAIRYTLASRRSRGLYAKHAFTPLEKASDFRQQGSLTGFTLVELMLVVVILGILVSMVVPRLAGKSEQARKAAAKADIEGSIAMALDMYEMDNGSYPDNLAGLMTKPSDTAKDWNGPYLKKKPIDPWGREYIYKYPGDNNDYDLYSQGTDSAKNDDDVTNWEQKQE